jgi:hypothetical protein
VRRRESHRKSNKLEQKPILSKTTLTSCQEWIRQQEGVWGEGGESQRGSYKLEQKPISS